MSDIDPQESDTPSSSDGSALPARIVIGEIEDPLIEIEPWQDNQARYGAPVVLDADQRTSFSALLSGVPALVQSAQGASAQLYHLTFSPEVAKNMKDVMKAAGGGIRANAVDANKKIIGQGVLHPANGAKALSAATAVWQGLAIVTAQVHLTEINARLGKLEQGIDTIKALLEAEQMSKLVTGLRYVREASATLARGEVAEHERRLLAAQIETIWLECGQVAHTCLQMLSHAPEDFQKLPLSAWYYLDESAELAQKALTDYERRSSAYLLAVYVRSATIALREPLQLNHATSEERWKQIQTHIDDWRRSGDEFFRIAQQRVASELSATLNKQATIDSGRRKLMASARDLKAQLDRQGTTLDQIACDAQEQLQQPLDLVVRLDDQGQISEAFRVPAGYISSKQSV